MITQSAPDIDVGIADDDLAATGRPLRRGSPNARRWWILAGAIILVILAIWGISRLVNGGRDAPRYETAPVGYADIVSTVEETGTVNPVNEVDVGTQVSGTITTLSVDYNSIVHKGQVLATLDETPFLAAAAQAHGSYEAAQSSAAAAQSTADQSAAAIRSAQAASLAAAANAQSAAAAVAKAAAQERLSQATIARDRSLISQGFISQSQMDTDAAAERANAADLRAAQAALTAANAQAASSSTQIAAAADQHATNVHQVQAAQAQAVAGQGQVQQADYNLARAVITSPIDGIVVSRAVSVGQTVAASFQTPTLFVIASSLRDMQVDTSVSEADVGQLQPGAAARITVPAFPNVVFKGTVTQVRVNPTTVQNVVTYDAIVSVHDDSARLKPGMTADVVMSVGSQQHVLAIPAAALLFHPLDAQRLSGGGFGGGGGGNGGSSSGGGQNGAGQQGGQVAGAPGSRASVYVLRAGKPVRVPIVIGANDGRRYEVRTGELQSGDQVIIGQLQANQYTSANPMVGPGFGR